MKSFFGRKIKICGPERTFEELEPRIVLDASVDSTWHDGVSGSHDIHSSLPQALPAVAADHGYAPEMAADAPDTDFNVVLISDALPEQDMLINAASHHANVVVFDSAHDNLDTINVRLHDIVESSGKKIDHLAVLDHAKAGEWRIGTDKFSLFGLPSRRPSFETLGSMLSPEGQIQLYGCELAGNPMGQALVDRIALYTQADVFASFDKVGGGSHHQEVEPAHSSVSPVTSSLVPADPPDSHTPLADSPSVDAPQQPLVVNLGAIKLVHLGHSFSIDGSDPSQHVTATVSFDSPSDAGEGITGLKVKNPDTSSATIEPAGPDSHEWIVSGSVEDVNKVLGTMRATAGADFTGEAHVTVATVDPASLAPLSSQTLTIPFPSHALTPQAQPSAASHQESNDSSLTSVPEEDPTRVPFQELPLRPGDPPVIRIDVESMSVHGEQAHKIPEIEVYDPGSRFVDVVLKANNGTLSAPNPLPRPGIEVRGNNGIDEPVLRLSGLFTNLNDTLKQVTYKPHEGYEGPDDLTVEVHSRGGYSNEIPPVAMVEKILPIEVENA